MEPTSPVINRPVINPQIIQKKLILGFIEMNCLKKYLSIGLGIIVLMVIWVNLSSPLVATVTGTGKVDAPAANVSLSLSLVSTDPVVKNAIDSVVTKVSNIRKILMNNGILEKDIIESQITIVNPSVGSNGYKASISVGAVSNSILGVNDLINKLYEGGADTISQPYFSTDKQNELEDKALALALEDAKTKANDIAKKNWKLFKKVITITSQSSGNNSTAASKSNSFKIAVAVSVSYQMW